VSREGYTRTAVFRTNACTPLRDLVRARPIVTLVPVGVPLGSARIRLWPSPCQSAADWAPAGLDGFKRFLFRTLNSNRPPAGPVSAWDGAEPPTKEGC
jgi:hypothetical protein